MNILLLIGMQLLRACECFLWNQLSKSVALHTAGCAELSSGTMDLAPSPPQPTSSKTNKKNGNKQCFPHPLYCPLYFPA